MVVIYVILCVDLLIGVAKDRGKKFFSAYSVYLTFTWCPFGTSDLDKAFFNYSD